jgi:predicted metal-dependent peptidase
MSLAIGKKLTAEQRLNKAMTDIIGRDEYIAMAGVLMIGKRSIVEWAPTACTNGRDEFYGREFVDKLSDAEFRFVILHENYHKMYKHLTTWKHLWDKDKRKANQACDYVINLKLAESSSAKAGWLKIPKGALLDESYAGMDTKQVFDLLPDCDGNGEGGGGGGGEDGEGFDIHDWLGAQDLTAEEREELARDIDEALRQGTINAGKVGSGGNRDIEDLIQTKRDWRELLREYVTTTCAGKDYSTWRRPNRKYIGAGIIMPSSVSETMGELVIAVDTSGSIQGEFLRSFLGEVMGICDQIKPSKLHLLYWDTQVCRAETYLQDDLPNVALSTKPEGGGGTDVACVPPYLAAHGIAPECVVVLTDGYLGGDWGNWSAPVLWCIKDNPSASPETGTVVHID